MKNLLNGTIIDVGSFTLKLMLSNVTEIIIKLNLTYLNRSRMYELHNDILESIERIIDF